ncbi:SDR family oxidoreductase [Meridianimarinicoccus sp. RP-17]|uniref:SDR family oxidoreductase n=1 Tax=Meridianimarinicoccus zhengii TaxID=2056810 RepID=UPI002E2581B2
MTDLEGATALVTGAANGIGAACAGALHAAGASVRLLDIDQPAADKLRSTAHIVDITDETAVQAHFAQHGPVDILVNCAGIVPGGSIADCSTADFRSALDVNVTGTFLVTRAAVREALAAGRPLSIVNIASVISSIATAPDRLAYATSKAAIIGMTKSVALDFIKDGIRCNAVCPGTIDTAALRERIATRSEALGGETRALEVFNNRQPIGRMGTPEEIAQLVLFVASDRVGFMTGTELTADGGFSL